METHPFSETVFSLLCIFNTLQERSSETDYGSRTCKIPWPKSYGLYLVDTWSVYRAIILNANCC
jgi:hypothetical protein